MRTRLFDQLEPFTHGNWVYEGWPEFHPPSAYDSVQQQYLDRCRAFPGVRSVWKVGELSVAGISDIDFVVEFDDPLPNREAESLSIHRLDTPGPYLCLHQPLFLSESLLREFFSWRYVSRAVCLYGDASRTQVLPQDQLRTMALVSLCHVFATLQPRLLLRTLLGQHMHVRGTLCQINACKHMLHYYHQATRLPTTEWDSFAEEFAEFRRRWFDLGPARVDRLQTYVVQAIVMVFELMSALSQAMADQGWFRPDVSNDVVHFLASGFVTRFVARWDCATALSCSLSEWRHSREVVLDLPLAFAEPLRSFTDRPGLLNSHVRQYLWPVKNVRRDQWRESLSIAATRDTQARNGHVEFLLRNGLLWGDANFDSIGLWPSLLTDRSLRGRLRRPYYQVRRLWRIAQVSLVGLNG